MRKGIVALLILITVGSCRKNCWHCNSVTADEYAYIKEEDTVLVQYLEGGPNILTSDSLRQLGYTKTYLRQIELPISFEYCDEGSQVHIYRDCYRIK